EREHLPDHPAHREAHEVRLPDAEPVEEAAEVLGHLLEGVRARRRARLAVAARVEAQHAVAVLESFDLRVPHAQVAGQRVAERHHRSLALDLVVDVDAVRIVLHGPLLSSSRGAAVPAARGAGSVLTEQRALIAAGRPRGTAVSPVGPRSPRAAAPSRETSLARDAAIALRRLTAAWRCSGRSDCTDTRDTPGRTAWPRSAGRGCPRRRSRSPRAPRP